MKPKTVQMREIHTTMVRNKNLINSLKQQVVLTEQKVTLLQQEMKEVRETLKLWSEEAETEIVETEEELRKRYTKTLHKNPIRGGKETGIYRKWRAKQK